MCDDILTIHDLLIDQNHTGLIRQPYYLSLKKSEYVIVNLTLQLRILDKPY